MLLSSHPGHCLCHVLGFGICIVYLVFQVRPHFFTSLLPDDHIPLAWPQHSLAFGEPCPDDLTIPAAGSSTSEYHTRITRRDELRNQGFPGLHLESVLTSRIPFLLLHNKPSPTQNLKEAPTKYLIASLDQGVQA